MASKRKRDNAPINLDSDHAAVDDAPSSRSIKSSPHAGRLSDSEKLKAIRKRLGTLQLDSNLKDRGPSAPEHLFNFSREDFVEDDQVDEDDINVARLAKSAELAKARRDARNKTRPGISIVDITDTSDSGSEPETIEEWERDRDDSMTDDEFNQHLVQLNRTRTGTASAPRPASPQRTEIESFLFKGDFIRLGKTVELFSGEFLRVKRIFQDSDGSILLSGCLYRRSSGLSAYSFMPRQINELVEIILLTEAEFDRGVRAKEVEVASTKIKKIRRLSLTNLPYDTLSAKSAYEKGFPHAYLRAEGLLFSRWKYIKAEEAHDKTNGAKRGRPTVLSLLRRKEADKDLDADPALLRELWRGPNSPGGSFKTTPTQRTGARSDAIPVDEDDEEPTRTQYLLGDTFCGGGGVSSGVRSVPGNHIKIKYGVDMNKHAFHSYRLNFSGNASGATSYLCPLDLFLTLDDEDIRVDILHASPPCQFFSAAHTVASPVKDEMNTAPIFGMWELILRSKPRIVTMEETCGLLERHGAYFNALLHIFTSLEYSVQWKIINVLDFGVPQMRKRLIIIASCIGQELPPFPKATHGPGLIPYVTISDAISNIPADHPYHNITIPRGSNWPKKPRWDKLYENTITCNPDVYHPSGTRPYTIAELMRLQGIPDDHKFSKHEILKQIGNAVPPPVAKALATSIVEFIREDDGLRF